MFITYKTICTVTGNYYIGSHKQTKEDDYLGSGKELTESILKYGRDNHYRITIAEFDDRQSSVELEHLLIKEAKTNDEVHLLNKSNGGQSFDFINTSGKNLYEITPENFKVRCCNLERGRQTQLKNYSDPTYMEQHSTKISNSLKQYYKSHDGSFKNKKHDEETKQKISEKMCGKGTGKNNSQYGSFWITDGCVNKKWKQDKGDLPVGFYKGRVT